MSSQSVDCRLPLIRPHPLPSVALVFNVLYRPLFFFAKAWEEVWLDLIAPAPCARRNAPTMASTLTSKDIKSNSRFFTDCYQ